MLRIGYFLAGAQQGLNGGGTGPYATRILENLLRSSSGLQFHIFVAPHQVEYVRRLGQQFPQRHLTWSIIHIVRPLAFLLRPLAELGVAKRIRLARQIAQLLNYVEWQVRRYRVDVLYSPVQILPTTSWRTPTIITMHDIQELHYPEFFTPYERALRANLHWWALESATNVVVSFDHVKADLVRYFRLPPEKIHVCPIPITNDWLPSATPSDAVSARYKLAGDVLLYPAQTWPHKNHLGLIKALAILRDTDQLTPTLVCTGKTNAHFSQIEAEIERLGLQSQVRFLGMVSDEDLAGLYRIARCVVVPTLYEAGSFPVIEAILLGAPIICSRVTSLPETIGDPAFTFDANDPTDIAGAIRLMLTDQQHFARNLYNAELRRQVFATTPRVSADAFEQLYMLAAGAKRCRS